MSTVTTDEDAVKMNIKAMHIKSRETYIEDVLEYFLISSPAISLPIFIFMSFKAFFS